MAGLLAAGFMASAWLCIAFTRHTGGMAMIWIANAFLTTAFVALPRGWRPVFAGFGLAFLTGVSMLAWADHFAPAVLLSLCDVAESAGVAYLLAKLCHKRLNTPLRLATFMVLCLMPVALASSAAAGLTAHLLLGDRFGMVMRQWFGATFLGSAVVTPMLLMLMRDGRKRFRLNGPAIAEAAAGLLVFIVLFNAPSLVTRSASIVLTFPALTALAFRRGPKAAAATAFTLGAIALPVIVARQPDNVLMGSSTFEQRIMLIQIYVAALFVTALATALAVEEQVRLRRLLERRTVAARAARAVAEAASRAKTDFLATMSHEIRTPMNSIIGFTEVVLRRDDLPAEARRQLGLVDRSGQALLTVVNDILDFSKVEAGQVQLSPRPVQARAMARDALAIVAEPAGRKGLDLDLVFDGPDRFYLADDHRMRQVLLNLLNNAIKFTAKGSIRLSVAVRPGDGADGVRFAVTDTGVGIPAEALPRLFQRFSQADSSISRSHGGTGLGLAICKGLVELMGGKVGVDSTPGHGSTFWFEVPMVHADGDAEARTVGANDGAVAAHVLLVDDHPMNRELGLTVLSLLGCTADVAGDGLEAIALVKANRYDAILMDVHMPGMDGLAATRAIRLIEGPAARTPVIAMSADVLPEQVARAREAGMVDSVAKPISIEAVAAVLGRWVGRDAEGEARAA